VVVIASGSPDLSHRKYLSADLIKLNISEVTDFNIATLPNFYSMLLGVDSASIFYVSAVPVTYGLYESNLQEKPQLLGRPLIYPGNTAAKKTWKD
jgi:hypothetical protein